MGPQKAEPLFSERPPLIMYSLNRHISPNGSSSYRANSPLDLSTLARVVPSAFAEAPHDSRSEKYQHIPTHRIITALSSEGFHPISAMQSGSRDVSKRAHTKHLIRFRHVDSKPILEGLHHELCLLNSHDGSSSYRLMAGMFRLACSNGLIVSEGPRTEIRIPHKGDIVSQVIDGSYEVVKSAPLIAEKVRDFQALQLSTGEQLAFAKAAMVVRFGEELEKHPIAPERIIKSCRAEDHADTLWNTYNRVQEHLTKGGHRYETTDERGYVTARRRTRPIGSVDGNVSTNRALWTLATEMAKLKAA